MQVLPLRQIFIALSPALLKTLTFGLGAPLGGAVLIAAGALLAVLGAALTLAPEGLRKPVIVGLAFVIVFGVFQELIQIMMQSGAAIEALRQSIYTWEGLTLAGALTIFILASGGAYVWTRLFGGRPRERFMRLSAARKRYARAARVVLFILVLVLLPVVAGSYIGQVMMLVGLYILMGMGLNLEVGLAGLLDLGFVAFFAVGAYATAILTADSSARARQLYRDSEPFLLGRHADRGPSIGRRRGPVRHSRARRARRLSGSRHHGPRRDRARRRAIGHGRAAARRCPGNSADSRSRGSTATSSPTRSSSSI